MNQPLILAVALVAGVAVSPALAQDNALRLAVGCAPLATTTAEIPIDALRVLGAQDTVPRSLFGTRDLLVIGGGTGNGVQLDQQFFVRRPALPRGPDLGGLRAVTTVGWLRIVAVNLTTAIGLVEVVCGGIAQGDYLEPYAEPVLPVAGDNVGPLGDLDFSSPSRLLFGEEGYESVGIGRFMISDAGAIRGASLGTRYAIYRDLRQPGMPLVFVGEAMVFSASADTSVVRVTAARDAVLRGDLLIPRRR